MLVNDKTPRDAQLSQEVVELIQRLEARIAELTEQVALLKAREEDSPWWEGRREEAPIHAPKAARAAGRTSRSVGRSGEPSKADADPIGVVRRQGTRACLAWQRSRGRIDKAGQDEKGSKGRLRERGRLVSIAGPNERLARAGRAPRAPIPYASHVEVGT